MSTPPNPPPNPRIRVANPGEEKPRNKMWETIKIAAITTLAGAAAVGIGASVYKYAVKRTRRLLRREEQREENSQTMHPSYQQAVGYPFYPQGYGPAPGYAYAPQWPSVSSERDRMPEALREIPNFQPTHPAPAPVAGPAFVAAPPPPPSADPNMRRFMDDMRKRLANIESYLQEDPDDDEDDDDDRKGKN